MLLGLAFMACEGGGVAETFSFAGQGAEPGTALDLAGGTTMAGCFQVLPGGMDLVEVTARPDTAGTGAVLLMHSVDDEWTMEDSIPMDWPGGGESGSVAVDWALEDVGWYCVAAGLDADWSATPSAIVAPSSASLGSPGMCTGGALSGDDWAFTQCNPDWAWPIVLALHFGDADGDGYPSRDDCDDADPAVWADLWYPDEDGDGVGVSGGDTIEACDDPGPGWATRAGDCDDHDVLAVEAGSVFCPGGDGVPARDAPAVHVTCCEVSTAWLVLPAIVVARRRKVREPAGR